MSFNIVDLVKDQLGSSVTTQIASILGEDAAATQSAVDGAVPSILGGLISSSGSEEGRGLINGLLEKQDTSMLGNLGNVISGGNHHSLVTQGASMLGSLFGGNSAVGGLAGAISRSAGLGSGSSTSLLSMLAPIVMSVLRGRQDESGLDSNGVFQLLSDQRDNVSAAIPAGFKSQLGDAGLLDRMSGGLLDGASNLAGKATGALDAVGDSAAGAVAAAGDAVAGVTDAATGAVAGVTGAASDAISSAKGAADSALSSATDAAGSAVSSVSDATSNAASAVSNSTSAALDSGQQAVKSGGSMLGKLIPIAIVLAGLFLVWKFFLGGNTEMPDVAKIASGEVNISEQFTGVFGKATTALEGITDADSANAALPALKEIGTTVEGLSGKLDSLPDAVSGPAKALIGEKLSGLQGLVEKIQAIPGVGDIIAPVVSPILNALASMGG